MNTDEQPSLTEILTSTEPTSTTPDITPFKCQKCAKSFFSAAGLNMHDARVHTRKILARGQKGHRANPKARAIKARFPSSDLETRRRKYREMRDRYRALGLDAKGRPFKTKHGRALSLRKQQESLELQEKRDGRKGSRKGRKINMPPWSAERRAKFERLRAEKESFGFGRPKGSKGKRIQFVYPVPGTPTIDEAIANTWPEKTDQPTTAIRFCPHCGTNIERHL